MTKWLLTVFLLLSGCSHVSGYEPWVTDEFFFHKAGEIRTYSFVPSLWSRPEIVLFDSGCVFPKDLFLILPGGKNAEEIRWKVTAKVFRGGKILEEMPLKLDAGWASEENYNCYKSVSFGVMGSVAGSFLPREVTVVVTVQEVDPQYSSSNSAITFGIRNSPIP